MRVTLKFNEPITTESQNNHLPYLNLNFQSFLLRILLNEENRRPDFGNQSYDIMS